jgi:hypothetical protein
MATEIKLNESGEMNGMIIHKNPEISSRELMKLKIKDGGLEMVYSETFQLPGQEELMMSENVKTCHYLPHKDMLAIMDCFVPHLLLINEIMFLDEFEQAAVIAKYFNGELATTSFKTNEYLNKHFVSGLVISGDAEHRGVTIIGGKKLKGNKVLNLITPFVKFEDDNYSYGNELRYCIGLLEKECWLYLNGKSGQGIQLNAFDDFSTKLEDNLKKDGFDVSVSVSPVKPKKTKENNTDQEGAVI